MRPQSSRHNDFTEVEVGDEVRLVKSGGTEVRAGVTRVTGSQFVVGIYGRYTKRNGSKIGGGMWSWSAYWPETMKTEREVMDEWIAEASKFVVKIDWLSLKCLHSSSSTLHTEMMNMRNIITTTIRKRS